MHHTVMHEGAAHGGVVLRFHGFQSAKGINLCPAVHIEATLATAP